MNAARNILEEQINNETPVEARIAKLESDVEHIKDVMGDIKLGVQKTQTELKAANDSIAVLQKEVAGISATLPHLATKADLSKLEGALGKVEVSLGARIGEVEGSLNAKIEKVNGELGGRIGQIEASLNAKIEARCSAMEAKIIRWFIFTAIAIGSLSFSIARFVNFTRLTPSDVTGSPITSPAAEPSEDRAH